MSDDPHISHEELIQAADGELQGRRARKVHAHLEACWICRTRMAEIEETIVALVHAEQRALDPELPPIAGPRALLRARLAEPASKLGFSPWTWANRTSSATQHAAIFAALIAAVLVSRIAFHRSVPHEAGQAVAALEQGSLPDRTLTPGATRNATIRDVCSVVHEEVAKEVSASMRYEVTREYGIGGARPGDYEIDYLIPPGLGGTGDIHNLWPEPNELLTWNSYVKDSLEERLHQEVCAGRLDLSTAQRDIATDWIAAYKKYFHADAPLPARSSIGARTSRDTAGQS